MEISRAITEKRLLTFSYDGFQRTVEPHTFGVDKKGHEAVRAYQVGGGSSSGEYRGWKMFHVSEMSGLSVSSTNFASARPDYKPGDKAFSTIYAQL